MGVLYKTAESIARTAYKCFNLFIGTDLYFLGDRGGMQPHAWVGYFNVEGATRRNEDKAGNAGSFVPGIALSLSENIASRLSSLSTMLNTWALKYEDKLIDKTVGKASCRLDDFERILFDDSLEKISSGLGESRLGKSLGRFSEKMHKLDPKPLGNHGGAPYRFAAGVSGSLYWMADLGLQHLPDVYYPLDAPITDWYMYVAPTVSLYAGLLTKNYTLALAGGATIIGVSALDLKTHGPVYVAGGLTKSLAAFFGLLFAGKFHEKMHGFYQGVDNLRKN